MLRGEDFSLPAVAALTLYILSFIASVPRDEKGDEIRGLLIGVLMNSQRSWMGSPSTFLPSLNDTERLR